MKKENHRGSSARPERVFNILHFRFTAYAHAVLVCGVPLPFLDESYALSDNTISYLLRSSKEKVV